VIRVHELAKELKLTSKELMDKLKALKIDAKSHMSVLTEDNVKAAKGSSTPVETSKPVAVSAPAPQAAPKAAVPAAPATPAAQQAPAKPASRETSSIESAKALLQRVNTKPVTPVPPSGPKRPFTPQTSGGPTTPSIRRPVQTPLPQKPKVEFSKPAIQSSPEAPAAATPAPLVPGVPAAAPAYVPPPPPAKPARRIEIPAQIVVKDLSDKFNMKPGEVITRLIKLGVFATINQTINFEVASRLAIELGYEVDKPKATAQNDSSGADAHAKDNKNRKSRAPIVTFMGHVDHGKTSLLDAIRKTRVAAGEAGGITQHIGAYEVFMPDGRAVTFLDTPGHEAFTAMRARGARATDVVVLVVAADDGVMPQTIEAIDHAKAADVPIIVAINKIDLPAANPDKARKSLMEHGLMSEEWGGKTIMVGVSAKTGKGIDELLEMLALESELLELKADATAAASGVVIEAELSKESGVLAHLLVQDGTLRVGDVVVIGPYYCKVRAMINDRGQRIKEALPSMPVEILGLPGVPKAGDIFRVVKDERLAKEITDKRQEELRTKGPASMAHVTLEHLLEDVKAGKVSELKLIIKSDVQGSVEALRSTLGKIQSKNVRLSIIHSGTGDISESDVMLAAASNAVVIGFHVGIAAAAKEYGEKELVDVRFYEIIYEVKSAIEKAMEGLLEPEKKEVFVGTAEVRQVFSVSKKGTIAGCSVLKGKIIRNHQCRVTRGGQKVHEGKIESLKRFKDDAREVLEGFECGISVSNFDEILAGDRIEVYEIQEKARKLE